MRTALPLRYSIPLFLVAGSLLFGIINYRYSISQTYRHTVEQHRQYVLTFSATRNDIEYALNRNDPAQVRLVIAELGSRPDIEYAHFTDSRNRIIASSRRELIATVLETPSFSHDENRFSLAPRITVIGNNMYTQFPVSMAAGGHELRTRKHGYLYVLSDISRKLEQNTTQIRHESVRFGATLLAMALGIWVYIYLMVERRLRSLQTASRKLGAGSFNTRVQPGHMDELGQLAISFNQMGERLEHQQSHLQSLQSALDEHAIVSITNTAGIITYVNDKFCSISKYSREELLGQNHRLVKSDVHSRQFYSRLWETITAGRTWQGLIENRTKEGKHYWVQSTIVPTLDENGLPTQYISVRTDVTQRERLRRGMEMLASATEGLASYNLIAQAICIGLNSHTAGLVKFNHNSEHADVLSLWTNNTPGTPGVIPVQNSFIESAMEHNGFLRVEGKLNSLFPGDRLLAEQQTGSLVVEPMKQNDTIIGLIFSVYSDEHCDDDPEKTFFRLAAERASLELVRATTQATLVDNNRQIRAAQRMAKLGSWTYNVITDELTWSDEVFRIFELSPDQSPSYELFMQKIHPDDRVQVAHAYETSIANKTPYSIIHRLLLSNNKIKWVHEKGETSYSPEGTPQNTTGYVHDITEQAETENLNTQLQHQLQQAQKMETIGQLTGGIAHDFNNILASMIGYARLSLQMFGADEGSGKLAIYQQEVVKAGERARDLVLQMLSFGRTQSGQQLQLNVSDVLAEVTGLLQSTLPSSMTLDVHTKDSSACEINGDAVQLHQVLTNLIINSRDAVGEHGIIRVETGNRIINSAICTSCHKPFKGEFVEISVSDNGQGISQDTMDRIFEPFYTTKDIGKGSGMGLSMVHGIVHQHEGHILVESEENSGTTFRLLFPQSSQGMEQSSGHAASGDTEATVSSSDAHILIVDDEPGLTGFLQELLEFHGYQVTSFNDSEQALQWFRDNPHQVRLLITDQTMPGKTGVELSREVLRLTPDMPIILCTGYSASISEADAYSEGIAAFMRKPFDNDDLLERIGALIENRA